MYFVCNFVLWRQCILLLMYYHFLERYVIYFFSKFFHSWQHWVEDFFRVSIFWREFFIFIEKLVNQRWFDHWCIQILMCKSVNWNVCLIDFVHFLGVQTKFNSYWKLFFCNVEQCIFCVNCKSKQTWEGQRMLFSSKTIMWDEKARTAEFARRPIVTLWVL